MGAPGALDFFQRTPGFALILGERDEHKVVQQATGGRVTYRHFGVFTEMGIAQCNHTAIGQGSDLASARVRTAKLVGIEHPLGCAPSLTAVGTAAQETGTVGTFEGFANHHSGQERTVSKLTDVGECGLTAAQLRNGVLINDIHVQRFHDLPPKIYLICN